MRVLLLCLALIYPSVVFGADPAPAQTKYHGPSCIGEFCLNDAVTKEADLINKYGAGYFQRGKFSFHCYKVPDQGLFVHFHVIKHNDCRIVSQVLVSDRPNCVINNQPQAKMTKKPFESLKTREGIKIGDTYQKVVDVYGTPDIMEKGTGLDVIGLDYKKAMSSMPLGEEVLIYNSPIGTLFQSSFYIRDGKVSAMQLSISE